MEKAIKLAIEGGYKWKKSSNFRINGQEIIWRNEAGSWIEQLLREQLLLDPLFWQALGKSLGWEEHGDEYRLKGYMKMHKDGSVTSDLRSVWEGWQYAWHRFIDHLAEGKDAESFFTTLLSSNQ